MGSISNAIWPYPTRLPSPILGHASIVFSYTSVFPLPHLIAHLPLHLSPLTRIKINVPNPASPSPSILFPKFPILSFVLAIRDSCGRMLGCELSLGRGSVFGGRKENGVLGVGIGFRVNKGREGGGLLRLRIWRWGWFLGTLHLSLFEQVVHIYPHHHNPIPQPLAPCQYRTHLS